MANAYPSGSWSQQPSLESEFDFSTITNEQNEEMYAEHTFTFGQQQRWYNPQNMFSQRPYHNNADSYEYATSVMPAPVTASTGLAGPSDSSRVYQQQQNVYYQPPLTDHAISVTPSAKRHRLDDKPDDQDDDVAKEVKPKSSGACARCKNLKVKCEFRTDTDPCKRCLNGGHECVVPGRKKRRTPPKREHLLNQIRDQADQIKELMAQLEALSTTNNTSASSRPLPHSPSMTKHADLHSPVLSPISTHGSNYASDSGVDPETNKAVEDWIAKARESLAEFGGFIGVGVPKSYWVEADYEDSESDSDLDNFEDAEEGEYEIAVEDEDTKDVVFVTNGSLAEPPRKLRQQSSFSSIGTQGHPKKKDSGDQSAPKLISQPTGASPFGFFAGMTRRHLGYSKSAHDKDREGSAGPDGGLPAGINGSGAGETIGGQTARGEQGEVKGEEEESRVGVANPDFFKAGPVADTGAKTQARASIAFQQPPVPHILARGIVTLEEAEKLFNIYYDRMNLSVSLLDPELYTAPSTCLRSPFLFTVICAIASRFYPERPELYSQLMHYAQLAAGTALISGPKNIEAVSAYILLSLYPVPQRRWEEDRGWLYLGLAIRFAIDLNLHHPPSAKPLNPMHAREMLNRTRVWLNCFNLDRSTGSQYGKAPIIPNTDYVANHSEDWWRSSPYNMINFDIHLCAYNAELRVMAAFTAKIYSDPEHPTGLNREVDFEALAIETDEHLKRLGDKWFAKLEQTDLSDEHNCFRSGLLRLAYSYARLIALSYAFQHAFGKSSTDENPFLQRCLQAASDVVTTVVDNIGRPSQRVYLRHGPEAQSVFVTFAAAFLVKLLQPKFATYLSYEKRLEIRGLVLKVIDLLGGPEVAIDERHGPKLYAKFLKNLLASPLAKVEQSPPRSTHALPKRSARERDREHWRSKSASLTPEPERSITGGAGLYSSSLADALHSPFSGGYRLDPNMNANVRTHTPSGSSSSSMSIPTTVSNHPSPSTSYTLSPPPTQLAMSFDRFAPQGAAIDPFIGTFGGSGTQAMTAFGTLGATIGMNSMNINGGGSTISPQDALGMTMGMQEYMHPSLPFDAEIVQGIQQLTDPTVWQSISDPGSWLAQFSNATEMHMKGQNQDQNMGQSGDSMMFDVARR